MPKLIVFYNGACPVCRAEIEHYRHLDRDANAMSWRDIAKDGTGLTELGIDAETMRRRLHVLDEDGRLLVGIQAFARIWDNLARYRWLAVLARLPLVGTLGALLYEPLAFGLYAVDRRRRRARAAGPP